MANTKASATPTSGKAKITSFRYVKGFCVVSLDNGVSGIIGSNTDMPLTTMLQLKGQDITFEHVGEHDGHERYRLGFAL